MKIPFYIINCSRAQIFVPLHVQNIELYTSVTLILMKSVPIIVLNLYIAGITYRCKKMHSPTNVLLACTSICDFLIGMFSMLPLATILIMAILRTHSCILVWFMLFSSHWLGFLAFLLVCLGSVDRYFAVFQPFFYQKYIHNNRFFYIKCVFIIAKLVLLITILSIFSKNMTLVQLVILFVNPILIVAVLYIHTQLHFRVKMVRKAILALKPNMLTQNENTDRQQSKNNSFVANKKNNRDVKMNRLTLMVYSSTCISYIPYSAVLFLWHIKPMTYSWEWTHEIYMWGCILTYLKSLANPLIYLYRSKSLRGTIRRIWRKAV
ncbi:trace amine-associated receptor 8a-like [Hydra vulgaris]|uniref:Trace amine-associated receptor 8a-like n=1 Tax=Hydra vulgaris TaxID=6087 RepID=A0ABM4CRU6_HYDVU